MEENKAKTTVKLCLPVLRSFHILRSVTNTPTTPAQKGGVLFSYKLRYILGFKLVEMAISTNSKPTKYRNLYENTAPLCKFIQVFMTTCPSCCFSCYHWIKLTISFNQCWANVGPMSESVTAQPTLK